MPCVQALLITLSKRAGDDEFYPFITLQIHSWIDADHASAIFADVLQQRVCHECGQGSSVSYQHEPSGKERGAE
ncbi:hypothetical protein D1872_307770 [compost metagenome]